MLKAAVSALALIAAAPAVSAQTPEPAPAATAQSEDARLAAFFEDAFEQGIALSPQTQTQLGRKTRYGELDDATDAAATRALQLNEKLVSQMKRDFKYDRLSPASQLSWRLFEDGLEQARVNYKWRWHNYSITTEGSVAGGLPVFMINNHEVGSVEDARAYISRLKAFERVMGESADDLLDRARRGFVAPSFVFDPVIADARNVITGAPYGDGPDSALWADFKGKVEKLTADAATKQALLDEGRAALTGPVKRGYERFIAAVEQVKPMATSTDGVWRLPDGAAYYAASVRQSTTTDLTPDQVHQIGLKEVARIHAEMEAIKTRMGFKGSLPEFLAYMKTAPEFHYPNTPEGKQQFLADSRTILNDYMATGAPRQFSRLPKSPLEIRAVEAWREKTASIAFYNLGTPDGSRPGIVYVNLSDMSQVMRPQVIALQCHEGAPGHHFQIARSLEQADLPMFRRFGFYGAYIEGWGLYAEKLCHELGLYRTDADNLGRLSLELWRAARLVVDTGIHEKRWSRDKAMAYFRDNTLLSERDVTKEINRYIGNPGQATSYKIGQLKISELRAKSEGALGPKFDLKAFHEVILANGGMPLNILEEQVDAWIARARQG